MHDWAAWVLYGMTGERKVWPRACTSSSLMNGTGYLAVLCSKVIDMRAPLDGRAHMAGQENVSLS